MAQFVDTDDSGTIDKYEFTARELFGYDTQNGGTYKDRYNYRGQLTLKANLDPDFKKTTRRYHKRRAFGNSVHRVV